MKKCVLFISIVMVYSAAFAQQSNRVRISGTRLAYPIFQKWISEYSRENPDIHFDLDSGLPANSSDIVIAAYFIAPGSLPAQKNAVVVSKYIQLPIVNSHRSDLRELTSKGFSDAAFRQVFFTDPQKTVSSKFSNSFAVYTREKPACATVAFASHFGNKTSDLHGIGVKGDDKSLLEAVLQDTNAVSYNNLGFIYNTTNRKLVNGIAIIPIDLNENGKVDDNEKIYSSLDNVLSFTEKTNHSKIPVENVNAVYNKQRENLAAMAFLAWILKEGQEYSHELGFLKLGDSNIEDQLAILSVQNQPAFDLDDIYGKQN